MNNSKHQLEITDLDCLEELSVEEMTNYVGGFSFGDALSIVFPLNNPIDTYQDLKRIVNREDPETVAHQRGATLIHRAENAISAIISIF
jgi:hypothetical protein